MNRRTGMIVLLAVAAVLAAVLLLDGIAEAPQGSGAPSDAAGSTEAPPPDGGAPGKPDPPADRDGVIALARAEGKPVFVDVWSSG